MFKDISKETMKETIRVAAPAMFESFFASVVTFIDSKMVSVLGTSAVASVALTTQPTLLRLAPLSAINIATSALIARRKGEGKQNAAHEVLLTSLILCTVISLLVSVTFFLFADPIIRFAGSLEDTHDNAVLYFRILVSITFFTGLQNCINAAHRGAGFTKISMQTHLVSTSVNMLFNYLLIEGRFGFPRLEIKGAAIASAIGMVVASILSVLSLFRKSTYLQWRIMIREKIRPSWQTVKSVAKLSYSVFFEVVMIRVGLFLAQKMAAGLGTAAIAAHRVAGNFGSLSFSLGDGLNAAAVTLVGQSLGRGEPVLAKTYIKTCRILGVICSALVAVFFALFMRPLFGMFFTDPYVVDIGASLCIPLIIVIIIQIQQAISFGALRGAGETFFLALVGIIGTTLLRPVVAYAATYWLGFGLIGIWLGSISDHVGRLVACGIRLAKGKWMSLKI